MPDLTRMFAWTCCTNTWWTHKVQGSKGAEYMVTFGPMPPTHKVQYDYTCTCKAYEFGSGAYCKHITQVRKLRCGWNGELEPTAQVLTRDGEHSCPDCGGPVESIAVAV